jgi:AcrR family transcriptional regulator
VKKTVPGKKKEPDHSTEQKIKKAARKVFQQKGFAATRTRDIAEKAGINLALLNYYFRSKEKLFAIIMRESMQTFLRSVVLVFNDEESSLSQKVDRIAVNYIDILSANPDIPLFVLSELRGNAEGFLTELNIRDAITRSVFFRQLNEEIKAGRIAPVNPIHYLVNLVALCVFPFVASPMLKAVGGIDNAAFSKVMDERKKLIPLWYKATLKAK